MPAGPACTALHHACCSSDVINRARAPLTVGNRGTMGQSKSERPGYLLNRETISGVYDNTIISRY